MMNRSLVLMPVVACLASVAFAKLPVPVLTEEAKAKAAEAAAKTAHGNKLADFQLCKSREATAAYYFKQAKAAGKETKPATDVPPCVDPGPFVYPPPPAGASATTPVAAAAAPAANAAKTAAPAKPAAPAPVKK